MKRILVLTLSAMAILILLTSCIAHKTEVIDEAPLKNPDIVEPDFNKEELDEMFGTDEVYIVRTILPTPENDIESNIQNGETVILKKHYLLSDGTWECDGYGYKYMLEITGRLNNAVKDSTYIILSNNPDITFDMAWKASGLSSNSDDYFLSEEAVFVGGR